MLVLYPLIDAVATLIDARSQHGSARQWLLINAGTSILAAIALGAAATRGVAAAFAVFGVWAAVSGAAQLVVALRRRAQRGNQWPLLLATGVSVIGGIAFIIAAAVGHPNLSMLAIYAATGGTEFVIQAWLLTRRRRRMANATPVPNTLNQQERAPATITGAGAPLPAVLSPNQSSRIRPRRHIP